MIGKLTFAVVSLCDPKSIVFACDKAFGSRRSVAPSDVGLKMQRDVPLFQTDVGGKASQIYG